VSTVTNSHHRTRVARVLQQCAENACFAPSAVGLALLAATSTQQRTVEREQVEIVWTGPHVTEIPFRRTEQAILQVLDSAEKRVSLVSDAVYEIPHIREALVRAAARGAKLAGLLETPDRVRGKGEYDTLRSLGPEVAARSSVYYWPKEKRGSEGRK